MMDGEVLASGYINNGTCTLSFNSLNNVGTATLTVMGYNKATTVRQIEVLPAEGPYIVMANYSPNFAPVNVATNLTISFKNVGADPTNGNSNVTLTCADSRLSLINNTGIFGVLNAEETTTMLDAFSFIVEDGVEDGTRFQLDIDITDGRQTWSSKAFITAGQAMLEYVGTDWVGSFVPGETLTVVTNFKNVGHYMATNAIASITCESEYVTLLNPTIEMGTIDPEGISTCVFNIQIDPNCPESEAIPLSFMMQADGNLSAEGSLTMKNACNVVFELHDSYYGNDGWNNARLIVSFDDGTAEQTLTINNGSNAANYTLEIGNGTHVTLTWSRGSYDGECSFVVRYEGDDNIIYQMQPNTNPSAGVLYEFDCNCPGGQSLAPVENLDAEIGIGTVTLTWDEQERALNYIIIRNGIEIAQTEEPTFVDEVFTEFYYTYCIVAEYSHGNSIPDCIVVKSELGVDENQAEFSIYPNPVNGTLFVNGGNAEYSYAMYNGMGQMVANGTAKGTEQISVESLTKGVYFLRLTSGTQVLVEKVVVK